MTKRTRRPNATSEEQRAQYARDRWARSRLKNIDKRRQRDREYNKRRYWADPVKAVARSMQWAKDNPEAVKARHGRWKKNNKEKNSADTQKKSKALKVATPTWLNSIQKEWISFHYAKARFLSDKLKDPYVVDHVIPIQGELVRGLHVPWNLQVITMRENCRKSNKVG